MITKIVTGYLIDPWEQKVEKVTLPNNNNEKIYELIGARPFEVVSVNKKMDGIFVDEEGLYREMKCPWLLSTDWGKQALVNRGLMLGVDQDGQSTSPRESLRKFMERVQFGEDAFQGFLNKEVFKDYKPEIYGGGSDDNQKN
jgi:hypothetical protein